MDSSLGFAHFLGQADSIIKFVLVVLLLMSTASWYLMISKAVVNRIAQRRTEDFLKRFWGAPSLEEARAALPPNHRANAFEQLAGQALHASDDNSRQGLRTLAAAGGQSEFLTRVLRNSIDQEAARVESGLAILASTGSVAPYIGLLGTVWGIYHALIQIGVAGQGTLDKVAGPVGEALIMTGLGLAVAIPAVLGYNAFNRWNRLWLARLDAFAHDLYALTTIGEKPIRSTAEHKALRVVETA